MPNRHKTMREILMERLFGFFQGGLDWISNIIASFIGVSPKQHVNPQPVHSAAPEKSTNFTPSNSSASSIPEPQAAQPSVFESLFENRHEFVQLFAGAYAFYRSCDNPQFAAAAAASAWQHFTNPGVPEEDEPARRGRAPRPGRTTSPSVESVD